MRTLMLFLVLAAATLGLHRPAAADPIAFGQTIFRGMCSETHTYTFAATPGNRIYARLSMCGDYGGTCTPGICKFDQRLQLLDPNGAEVTALVSPYNHNCCSCRFQLSTGPVRLYDPGTYSLVVSDYDNSGGGDYALFVQDLTQPTRADTLHIGQPLIGTFSSCGEVDTYLFTVTAGDSVHLQVTSGTGDVDPRLEVFDDQGLMLTYPGSNEFALRSPVETTYRLLIYSGNGGTGTYTSGYVTPVVVKSWGHLKSLYR